MDKHIVNDPRNLALEAALGLAQIRPELFVDAKNRIITRTHDHVGIVSGGGSGHEPSFGGMVGSGLLSTAVAGNIFASPNVGQIRRGIQLADKGKGVLIIIMRYTGDVLHFGLAKEQSSVSRPDVPTHLLIVGDDVAVSRSQGSITGRRGLAGTVLVHKAAGAAAASGADFEQVKRVATYVSERIGTIGSGLGHCSLPGSTGSGDDHHLKANEIEIGMGIHNEPGVKTMPLPKTPELVRLMLNYITSTTDTERSFLPFQHDGGDQVVLLVNNLGGLSEMELAAIAGEALVALKERGIKVARVGAGRYMTSINLPGFSLTLLLLPHESDGVSSSQILSLLDAPTDAPGWIPIFEPRSVDSLTIKDDTDEEAVGKNSGSAVSYDYSAFEQALTAACHRVIEAEPEITKFDTIAGDGDCGTCLKAGAEEMLRLIQTGEIDQNDLISAIATLAEGIERVMDGTSGALYSIWMNALAGGFTNTETASFSTWSKALSHALSSLCIYTNARPPSRTLMDPLFAFTETLASSQNFGQAVQAANDATEETKNIQAKAGRAAYVGQDQLRDARVPDPGAYGVIKILEGIKSVVA